MNSKIEHYGSEAAFEILQNADLEDLKYISKRGWITVVVNNRLVSFAHEHAVEEFARIVKELPR